MEAKHLQNFLNNPRNSCAEGHCFEIDPWLIHLYLRLIKMLEQETFGQRTDMLCVICYPIEQLKSLCSLEKK